LTVNQTKKKLLDNEGYYFIRIIMPVCQNLQQVLFLALHLSGFQGRLLNGREVFLAFGEKILYYYFVMKVKKKESRTRPCPGWI